MPEKDYDPTVGRNVRRLRSRKGMTTTELETRAGIKNVRTIESYQRPWPRRETLEAIASALGCTLAEIVSDNSKLHPVLRTFLETEIGRSVSDDEAEALALMPLRGKKPTHMAYVSFLQGLRSLEDED